MESTAEVDSKNENESDRSAKRPKISEPVSHCKFLVRRKKRFCKMTVKEGEEYCGEHKKISTDVLPETEVSKNAPVRIVCPLDGKHTCYAHKLKRHLKICNARPKPTGPHIVKGINYDNSCVEDNSYRQLSTFSAEDIVKTTSKVNSIFEEIIQKRFSQKYSLNKLLEDEMLKHPDYGFKANKHLKQISSILGLLSDYDLMKPSTCFIEFGAGKGQLSFWLAEVTDKEASKVLLIERASPKHKKDNKIAKTTDKIIRIRADISDVVLDKLEIINKATGIVGVTKHLCGEATDLAIRCLCNTVESKPKINGCVLTFCCHHRCRWVPYTGKDFFKENGLDKNDFDIMCGMASWATCGSGLSRELRKEIDEKVLKQNERDISIGLNRQEKEEIGRRSKNVLNWGRLHYLEKFNFKCNLLYYVDQEITLENVCIVAVK